jgi:hypothetical protein
MPTVKMEEEDDEFDDMEVDRTALPSAADVKLDEDQLLDVESGDDVGEDEEDDEELGDLDEVDDDNWTLLSPTEMAHAAQELAEIRAHFQDEIDMFDTTMVAEYADDIFAHMEAMEDAVMPNPKYMDFQTEIEW